MILDRSEKKGVTGSIIPGDWRGQLVLVLLVVCTIVSLFSGILLGTGIAYTHLYYLPVTLSAIWHQRKAMIVSAYLFLLHFILELARQGALDPAVFVRGITLFLLALVVSTLTSREKRTEQAAMEYRTSLAERSTSFRTRLKARFDGVRALTRNSAAIQRMERDRDVSGLISALLDGNQDIRYQAASALGRIGDPSAMPALIARLHDSDAGVRWISAIALGRMGKAVIPSLVEATKDPDPDVRWRAVLALKDAGEVDAVRYLIDRLDDGDRYVRERAAIALGELGKAAVEACIHSLSDSRPRVRIGALFALGISGDAEALPILTEYLSSGDRETAEAAERALKYRRSLVQEYSSNT